MENLNELEKDLLKQITDTDDYSGGAFNEAQPIYALWSIHLLYCPRRTDITFPDAEK